VKSSNFGQFLGGANKLPFRCDLDAMAKDFSTPVKRFSPEELKVVTQAQMDLAYVQRQLAYQRKLELELQREFWIINKPF